MVRKPKEEEDDSDMEDEHGHQDGDDGLLEKYFKISDLIHKIITEEGLMKKVQEKIKKAGNGAGVDEAKLTSLTVMKMLKNHQNFLDYDNCIGVLVEYDQYEFMIDELKMEESQNEQDVKI